MNSLAAYGLTEDDARKALSSAVPDFSLSLGLPESVEVHGVLAPDTPDTRRELLWYAQSLSQRGLYAGFIPVAHERLGSFLAFLYTGPEYLMLEVEQEIKKSTTFDAPMPRRAVGEA